MIAFIIRRLIQSIIVMVAVAAVSFALFRFVGDPINSMVGQEASIDDRQALRDAGFSERDIWDIANVAGFFNMTNRVASATDMRPNDDYHAQAR